MEAMLTNLMALEEYSRDPSLVSSFHTMKTLPTETKSEDPQSPEVYPWRLLLNPGEDDPWNSFAVAGERSVESDWPAVQAGKSTTEQPGHAVGISAQSSSMSSFLDREDMLILLTQLSLKNEANYCYCNATMLCLWWSVLSRTTYQYGDWGASRNVMQTFFGQMIGPALSVRDFFHTLFTLWDHDTSPADAAEFAYYVLRWMGTPCISHKWSRLYMVENESRQHDLGDEFAPIFLQVPNPAITSICLQDLVTLWTQEYGMRTALLAAPEILLCHVDRNNRQLDGTVEKLHFWLHADHVCSFPVFADNDTQVSHDYVPVAMLAHLGDMQQGHYRGALRLTVADDETALSTQHTLWAITDDHEIPQIHPLPGLPEWLCRNLTMICLVKLSGIDISRPLRDPGAGWLRLRTPHDRE
eukprot:s436_g57.t1